jgi:hypothetical protein
VPDLVSYDYAVVRVVPAVEREELINAGAVVFCAVRDWLEAKVELDEARLRALSPGADVEEIRRNLLAIPRICAGGPEAGPIGALPRKERWHWLVAPRSTVIQLSPVHSGLCESLEAALERILDEMVRVKRVS